MNHFIINNVSCAHGGKYEWRLKDRGKGKTFIGIFYLNVGRLYYVFVIYVCYELNWGWEGKDRAMDHFPFLAGDGPFIYKKTIQFLNNWPLQTLNIFKNHVIRYFSEFPFLPFKCKFL